MSWHTHCFEVLTITPTCGMSFQFCGKHVIDKVAGTGLLVETEA